MRRRPLLDTVSNSIIRPDDDCSANNTLSLNATPNSVVRSDDDDCANGGSGDGRPEFGSTAAPATLAFSLVLPPLSCLPSSLPVTSAT